MFKINTNNLPRHEQKVVDLNNWAFDCVKKIKSDEVKENGDYLSHLSNCVVSIVPVKNDEAIYLFGEKQKSLTFNKVTIAEALVHKTNPSDIKKGKTLVEYFVSDEALSLAMIHQGGDCQTITFSQLENEMLDLSDIEPITNSVDLGEDNLNSGLKKQQGYMQEALEKLQDELEKARPSQKNLKAIFVTLNSAANNIQGNAKYTTETLAENLTKDINSVDFKIQKTLERLTHYIDAEKVNLLEDHSDSYAEQSYLKWLIGGGMDSMEKQTFQSIIKRIQEVKPSPLLEKAISDYSASLKTKSRPLREATDGALSFSTVMGQTRLAHDENIQDKSIEMRLSTCAVSVDYRVRYNINKEILRIAFSPNDLLMLLRSHKDSFILGTMTRFCNQGVPLVYLQESTMESIDLDVQMKGLNDKLKAMCKELQKLTDKSMKKADKVLAKELVENIEAEIFKTSKRIQEKGLDTQLQVKGVFEEKLRGKIEKHIKGLPNHYKEDIVKLLK